MAQKELFTIRQMIEITGLSEFTLRGWENRYKAFRPARTNTGRRGYSKTDIERALLLRELLKRGEKISKIAPLDNQKLQKLFAQTQQPSEKTTQASQSKTITNALDLMALQKWSELETLFHMYTSKDAIEMINTFLLPLLTELAHRVNRGIVSIAQEHIFSAFLKEKIYSALSQLEKKNSKSSHKSFRFILATPEGDYHEIGLLLAHLMLRYYGFTSLYLGPNTPSQDLAETAMRFDASHMLVVSTVSKKQGAHQDLLTFVGEVQKKVGRAIQVLIAGPQVPPGPNDMNPNLQHLKSFQDLDQILNPRGKL